MRVRRYGARGLLVEPSAGRSSAGLAAAIAHPDVIEVVPGAETVLVVASNADRLTDVANAIARLAGEVARDGSSDGFARDVVVDVVYDGDDLADVAAATGLSVEDVVSLHSDGVYRCDFCGFAPGFAYLSGLDPRLHLPRRATPRTSVPAGSIAIAGPYTAAYPSASPGGWHLLGHTDAVLWDLDADPPAVILPGATVRFNPIWAGSVPDAAQSPPRRRDGTNPAQVGARPVVRVVSAGVATTLQDRGRPGYAHLAVPGSGAVDRRSADLVNRLVGNPPDAAVLETAGGLVLEAVGPVVVADSTTGAVQTLSAGNTVKIDPAVDEQWAYVAVGGGFEAEPVLGSRSWDSLSRLGPPPPQPRSTLSARDESGGAVATDQAPHRPAEQVRTIRVREGPRADWFAPGAFDVLTGAEWTVKSASRVGVRLSGPHVARANDAELPSEGLVLGAVQLPPDGQPVVMLADHPTTGGYPVIAVVDEADVGRVAQCPPGANLRFRPIDGAGG